MKIVGTMTVEIPYTYDLGRTDDKLQAVDFEAAQRMLDDWQTIACQIIGEHRGKVTSLKIHSVTE